MYLFLGLVTFLLHFELITSVPLKTTHASQLSTVDFDRLREKIHRDGLQDSGLHVKRIMQAINQDQKHVFITVPKNTISFEKVKTFRDMSELAYTEVVFDYQIKPTMRFHSLDLPSVFTSIRSMDAFEIEHCGAHSLAASAPAVGDVFIASRDGESVHSRSHSSLVSSYLQSHHVRRNEHFLILRRVIKRFDAPHGSPCTRLATEDIHPLEILESVNIHANVSRPVQTTLYGDDPHDPNRFKLSSSSSFPIDSGLTLCTNSELIADTTNAGGQNWQFDSSILNGIVCGDYSSTVGGFNFNYDPITKSAVTSPMSFDSDGITGVTCDNCYAYIGASFYIHIQYINGYFDSQVTVSGETGANIDIEVVNPAFSVSTKSVKLLPGELEFHLIPIGTEAEGLSLSWKFGGLNAEIFASGSAQGTASLSGGAGATASLDGSYISDFFGVTADFSAFVNPPRAEVSEFSSAQMSMTAIVTGELVLQLSWAEIIKVNTPLYLGTEATISLNMGSTKFTVQVGDASSLIHTATSVKWPGDLISIFVNYTNFVPSQDITFFYTLKSAVASYPIMMKRFNTSSSGQGVFQANWTVPWDAQFYKSGVTWELEVHGSHLVHLQVFGDVAVIFGDPLISDNDLVLIASPPEGALLWPNKLITVTWDTGLLHYFQVSGVLSGSGTEAITTMVKIYLLSNSSKVLLTISPNSGSAVVTIPPLFLNSTAAFLVVESMNKTSLVGWSGLVSVLGRESVVSNGVAPLYPRQSIADWMNAVLPITRQAETTDDDKFVAKVPPQQPSCQGVLVEISFNTLASLKSVSFAGIDISADLSLPKRSPVYPLYDTNKCFAYNVPNPAPVAAPVSEHGSFIWKTYFVDRNCQVPGIAPRSGYHLGVCVPGEVDYIMYSISSSQIIVETHSTDPRCTLVLEIDSFTPDACIHTVDSITGQMTYVMYSVASASKPSLSHGLWDLNWESEADCTTGSLSKVIQVSQVSSSALFALLNYEQAFGDCSQFRCQSSNSIRHAVWAEPCNGNPKVNWSPANALGVCTPTIGPNGDTTLIYNKRLCMSNQVGW